MGYYNIPKIFISTFIIGSIVYFLFFLLKVFIFNIRQAKIEPTSIPGIDLSYNSSNPTVIMENSPVTFDDFIGQDKAVSLLKMHVIASTKQQKAVPHIMLEGPGGTGKTTLALCVANEIGKALYITTPSTFKDKDSVIDFFFDRDFNCKIKEGDVIFIDEIHRLREAAAIYIYSAMQDFYIDVGGAIVELPEFTVIGATTDLGLLASPFRDRFKIRLTLDQYLTTELTKIIETFKLLPKDVSEQIAVRSAGIPRIAKSIADSVIAYVTYNDIDVPTVACLEETCKLLEIDSNGLTKSARKVIKYFQETYNVPCGIVSLAGAVNVSRDTLEFEIFPLLLNKGLLMSKGTRGKCLTEKGMKYA